MDEMGKNNSAESENEIERIVRDTEAINLIFNEPTNLLKDLIDSFGRKNYAALVENGRKGYRRVERGRIVTLGGRVKSPLGG